MVREDSSLSVPFFGLLFAVLSIRFHFENGRSIFSPKSNLRLKVLKFEVQASIQYIHTSCWFDPV